MRKIILAALLMLPTLGFAVTENYDAYNGFLRPPGRNGGVIRFTDTTTSATLVQPDAGAKCLKLDPPIGGNVASCSDTSPSTVCGTTGFPATTSNTAAWNVNSAGIYMDNIHSSPTTVVYIQAIDVSASTQAFHWYTRCK